MKTIIDEILTEWNDLLSSLAEKQKVYKLHYDKLDSLRSNFVFIRKFFTPVENTRKRIKKTPKKDITPKKNITNKENISPKNNITIKKKIENIVFTEKQQKLINVKCPSLTDLSKVKEVDIIKKDQKNEPEDPFGTVDDKVNQPCEDLKVDEIKEEELPILNEDIKDDVVHVQNDINVKNDANLKQVKDVLPDKVVTEKIQKPKKNIKNILESLKSKSKKKVEQNKENIMDQTIIIEDGEIKLFKNKEKKRLKEYLKESKKKQKDEPKEQKQNKIPFDMVYDVGTNQFINPTPPEKEKDISPNVSPVKSTNKLKTWKKDTSIKDGLYKQIIDKEIFKSRSLMNSYKPRSTIPEISSDDEDSYVATFANEPDIDKRIAKQNHEEIEKYFSTDLTIDIEMLFPNIKDISNNSPNKWE